MVRIGKGAVPICEMDFQPRRPRLPQEIFGFFLSLSRCRGPDRKYDTIDVAMFFC